MGAYRFGLASSNQTAETMIGKYTCDYVVNMVYNVYIDIFLEK